MDYNYKETFNCLSKVLGETLDKNSKIDISLIVPSNQTNLSKLAFIIFCLEPTCTLENKTYQSVIQFFLLSCFKQWKYQNPNHDNEQTALNYAYSYLFAELTSEKITEINEFISKVTYNKTEIITFFDRLEVLSDWSSNNPLRIHKEKKQFSFDGLVNQNILGLNFNNLSNVATNFSTNLSNMLGEKLVHIVSKKENKSELMDLLGHHNPSAICFEILQNNEKTKKEKYLEILSLLNMIVKEFNLKFKSDELTDIIDYHFNEKLKPSVEIKHDTEKLFEEYLSKNMDLIFLLKGKGPEVTKSLENIREFSQKITDNYLSLIKNEINILNKFLEAKIKSI